MVLFSLHLLSKNKNKWQQENRNEATGLVFPTNATCARIAKCINLHLISECGSCISSVPLHM